MQNKIGIAVGTLIGLIALSIITVALNTDSRNLIWAILGITDIVGLTSLALYIIFG
jgi:hypothetical protein